MVTNNQILLILTVPITIGAVVTILSFLLTSGVIGDLEGDIRSLSDQVDQKPSIDEFLAQLPVVSDPVGTNTTDPVLVPNSNVIDSEFPTSPEISFV